MPVLTRATRNPWTFVPLMYFLQAIPVALVQEVATIVYKDLGVANESITRWTSIVALPWSLQMLVGPLVDLTGTRRQWIVKAQIAIAAGLTIVPFLLQLPRAFELSLAAFFFVAIASVLCNAAQDGFYLMALPKDLQAKFAGVQTTCYRLGSLFASSLLVLLSGKLVQWRGLQPASAWTVALLLGAGVYAALYLLERRAIPRPEEDVAAPDVPGEASRNVGRTLAVVGLGVSGYFTANALVRLGANALAASVLPGMEGWRLAPDGKILGHVISGPGAAAEMLQLAVSGSLAIAFLVLARRTIRNTAMGDAFGSFFRQTGIVAILAFMMLYRFGEAMVGKISPLFFKDSHAAGGLGFENDIVGTIKGFGIVGIVLGGILGGWIVGKFGVRKSIFPIAVLMHLPNLLYLWAAHALPGWTTMVGVDFVEKFGYGFGLTAYFIILQRIAQKGKYRTAHYALGVGVGALFIQVAGILSGVLQANYGYGGLFLAAVFIAIPGLATLLFLPIDEPSSPA